jgi:hypothetical protein
MEHRTIWKLFFVWDFEKEEDWLNEMAAQGWALCRVGLCRYEFEPCEPDSYVIRMEMRSPDEGYIRFMTATGAEYIGRVVQWIYFRKEVSYGPFDLFSDIDSRIDHLKRISRMLLAIALINLSLGILNSQGYSRLGWINLLVASLLTYALGRMHGKTEALEKERQLRE